MPPAILVLWALEEGWEWCIGYSVISQEHADEVAKHTLVAARLGLETEYEGKTESEYEGDGI